MFINILRKISVYFLSVYFICSFLSCDSNFRSLPNNIELNDDNNNFSNRGPNGLPNIGNTCYMNSCFQILAFVPQYDKIFDYNGPDSEVKKLADYGKGIISHIKGIKKPDNIRKLLTDFYIQFQKLGWQSEIGQQESAPLFIELIAAKLNFRPIVNKLNIVPLIHKKGKPLNDIIKAIILKMFEHDSYSDSDESATYSMLTSSIDNNTLFIYMPFPTERIESSDRMKVLYEEFTGAMSIEIDTSIYKGNSKNNGSEKIKYQLVGFILRRGEYSDFGHYIAYTTDNNGQWYCCNDSNVSKVCENEINKLTSNMECLFYKKLG